MTYGDTSKSLVHISSTVHVSISMVFTFISISISTSTEVDNGKVGAIVLLDMSTAFDTINHDIMLDILYRRFNIQDAALERFASYFMNQTQVVVSGSDSSAVRELKVGTPQGSVLGPRSFIVYAEDTTDIFLRYHIHQRD